MDLTRRSETMSSERKETMEDDAEKSAPASSPATTDSITGQVTSSKTIEPDTRKAAPTETNGNNPEGMSPSLDERERTVRSLPSSDADDLLNNGSQRWLGTSGTTVSDAKVSEGGDSRTIGALSSIDGGFAEGTQTRQKDRRRRRVSFTASSISHQRSHPFRQNLSIPRESSVWATPSSTDPRLMPSSHVGPGSGERAPPAVPAAPKAAAAAAATPLPSAASPHSSKERSSST